MTWITMRRDLDPPPPAAIWPAGFRPGLFGEAQAYSVHGLYTRSYARGEGSIGAFEDWWNGLLTDAEFDPALLFAAYAPDGRVAAAAQCWRVAFIKDFAVDLPYRRQHLGLALLHHCFEAFARRGAGSVSLKVVPGNLPARRLYLRAGMTEVRDPA